MSLTHFDCPFNGCDYKTPDLPSDSPLQMHITLMEIHSKNHQSGTSKKSRKPLKIDPPSISAGRDNDQWFSFQEQWGVYKRGAELEADQCATALFHCCDAELRNDLIRDLQQRQVDSIPETELLAAIKRLAVKEEGVLVHRIKLNKMVQTPGTPIRSFLSDLKGRAGLCQFTETCKCGCGKQVDFSSQIIRDNLVRGIADPEITNDILQDSRPNMTLTQIVDLVSQKEQGKSAMAAIGDRTSAMSQYNPQKNRPPKPYQPRTSNSPDKCWACGDPSHGATNDKNTRAKLCRAWPTTCTKCNIKGHYTTCCSRCSTCNTWGHRDKTSRWCTDNPRSKPRNRKTEETLNLEDDEAATVYDQLCAVEQSTTKEIRQNPLDHHVFEGKWISRPSKPHPVMTVRLTPLPDDHEELGHPLRASHPTAVEIPMIADSGCQSSVIPLRTALAMGVAKTDIFPVKLTMRGAIAEDMGVEGGIFVEVSTTDIAGTPRSTKQLMYVSSKVGKAFLCREALVALGAIPHDFPAVPVSWLRDTVASVETSSHPQCPCFQRREDPPPMPTQLPPGLTATENNVPKLKQWLLDHYASSAFNTCEHQPLPMMKCEPLELHVDPQAKPVAIHKPGAVPIHWQEKVYQDLERDVQIGVLEKVSPNTPVTWCSRMVVTAKADGTPRRTVDLQPQNRHSVRQTHHVQSPFHLAVSVPQHKKKTVTDAWNGYHSVPIRKEDRHFTTFITPWGRYRYKVAPQGFLASGDAYTQRFDAIITDFRDKVKCVDDTCMWADSIEAAFFQTCNWLDLCARNGITLNPKKFQFCQDSVDFAGLTITPTNVKPSAKFLDSIEKFPEPKDITGARAWFGLVNQGAYAFSMAREMKPFRHLLKPKTPFAWTPELSALFKESKKVITEEMRDGVRLFQLSRPTCLVTDWSTSGIGFCLMQKYCNCPTRTPICCKEGWKLCLVGSRFTHAAETRYSPVEGECLAVVYALHQTRYYIQGCSDLTVATDHKPLIGILNDRSLSDIENRRLLNLKEKTLAYRFTIIHVAGKKNAGADAASRYPAPSAGPPTATDLATEDTIDSAEDDAILAATSASLYAVTNVVTWDMVREATASDDICQGLQEAIQAGFPSDCRHLPAQLRPYHRIATSLYCMDGVILTGSRIVVPAALRPDILGALHAAHQGVNAMIARAADSVYWPNITLDIQRTRDECSHCHRIAKSNAMQPPTDPAPPEYPFQQICSDYFTYNNHDYVVVVDRYSNWPMVFRSENGAEGLVKRLRQVFATFGVPEELTSDGGPQFTAGRTQEFLKSWGVRHRLTSVANPHANCRAEIAVKTVKRMLMDNASPGGSIDVDKFQKAMLVYRNSIDPETKASPALIIFGRPIRDPIPIPMGRYCPHQTWRELTAHREQALAKRHSLAHEKWTQHTRTLPPLRTGDHVYLQNLTGNHPQRWERTGIVVEVRQYHQYVIRVDGSGRTTIRNRQHLRKFTPFPTTQHGDPIGAPLLIPRHEEDSHTGTTPPPPAAPQAATPQPSSSTEEPDVHAPVTPQAPQSVDPEPSPSNAEEPIPTIVTSPSTRITTSPLTGHSDDPPQPPPQPTGPTPTKKVPRALTRLLHHNNPGEAETTPVSRRRNRSSQH